MDLTPDYIFMQRALQLAELGRGRVSPNPMVGCVIVVDGKIIGEGYHQKYGGPHAEVNAISSVVNQDLLKQATVYVSLEPCSHHGKTPPCADLLIKCQVKRVVIATGDPNPQVNGSGSKKLKTAGIAVTEGILEKESLQLNVRFNTFHLKKRPYIILKWAQTRDGFIARKDYSSRWISNSLSRQWVHKWRAEEDAVLVGKHTALYDDPSLTVRDWSGENPLRIVLDKRGSLPKHLKLFTDGQKTLVYSQQGSGIKGNTEWIKIASMDTVKGILDNLFHRNVQSIIIEGGSQVIESFIRDNLWDEARVFDGDSTFGEGIAAPALKRSHCKETKILRDRLLFYKNG